MSTTFAAGDQVICANAVDARELKAGGTYTVLTSSTEAGYGFVALRELLGLYRAERFVLTARAGVDHYRLAEEHLAQAQECFDTSDQLALFAAAQVHATLATCHPRPAQ